MNLISSRKRRVALFAIPAAGAVLLGGAGWATATGHGGSTDDSVGYHSSVTTSAKDDTANEAADELALAKAAKISLAQALTAGARAVPGGTATGVGLDNEAGNVVYTVEVVTTTAKTEVIIDAGNGHVLAQNAEHDQDHDSADQQEQPGAQQGSSSPASTLPGAGPTNTSGR